MIVLVAALSIDILGKALTRGNGPNRLIVDGVQKTANSPQSDHSIGDIDLRELTVDIGISRNGLIVGQVDGVVARIFIIQVVVHDKEQVNDVTHGKAKGDGSKQECRPHAPADRMQRMMKTYSEQRVGVRQVLIKILPVGISGQVIRASEESFFENGSFVGMLSVRVLCHQTRRCHSLATQAETGHEN
jgi:hypothetical protein